MNFVKMDYDILENPDLSAAEKMIVSVIKSYGSKGFSGSRETLCKYCGIKSNQTLLELINNLVSKKYITRIERKGKTTMYKYAGEMEDEKIDLEQWKQEHPELMEAARKIKEDECNKVHYVSEYQRIIDGGLKTKEDVIKEFGVIDDTK